tara:strand:- start:203 stop:547 length:345 start_codon:yes stop_codon:yes gene_type:complete
MPITRRNTNRNSKSSNDGGNNRGGNVKYNILSQEVVEWEPNNFIEISHKDWKSSGSAQGGATNGEFFSISRGYYANGSGDVEEGTPIYTKSITFPTEDSVIDSLLSALDKVVSG